MFDTLMETECDILSHLIFFYLKRSVKLIIYLLLPKTYIVKKTIYLFFILLYKKSTSNGVRVFIVFESLITTSNIILNIIY